MWLIHTTLCLLSLWAVYKVYLIAYRLLLHPLAKFPGPKLAAATHWYEAYYDLVSKGGGQWTFKIRRLHETYGPIIRINPDEIHIDDPDYYDVVYCSSTTSRPIDKTEKFRYRFSIPEATSLTAQAEAHRRRRAAIAPYFSKARLRSRNGDLQAVLDLISRRLATKYAGTGSVVNVGFMWAAMASDMITGITFGHSTNFSSAPDFTSPFMVAVGRSVRAVHFMTHFKFLSSTLDVLPDVLIAGLVPSFRPVLKFRKEMTQWVQDALLERDVAHKQTPGSTVFQGIMCAGLPPEDMTLSRLCQEAMGLNGAAVETTSWTLSVAVFHILHNSVILSSLQKELVRTIPDPGTIPPCSDLEELPYLSAVIMEALRLTYGSVQRLPRVNRLEHLKYGELVIPPNTAVGMDAYHMHMNDKIFPNPTEFLPDRWLGNPKGPDGLRPLSSYMVSFSRGARGCLGINLAWMELYAGLATLFRRHDLELFETSRDDVDFHVDLARAMPKWGSKGVRVIVK